MKKLIPLAVILLFSGCLTTVVEKEIIEIPDYNINDKLTSILFNSPYDQSNISVTIYRPDGTSSGTQTHSFIGRTISFPTETYLYHPGIWKVHYTINDILGDKYFYVAPATRPLSRFEVNIGESTFTVRNVGRAHGHVEIVVFAQNPLLVGENQYHGYTYLHQTEYIRIGQQKTFSNPSNDFIVMIGEL